MKYRFRYYPKQDYHVTGHRDENNDVIIYIPETINTEIEADTFEEAGIIFENLIKEFDRKLNNE